MIQSIRCAVDFDRQTGDAHYRRVGWEEQRKIFLQIMQDALKSLHQTMQQNEGSASGQESPLTLVGSADSVGVRHQRLHYLESESDLAALKILVVV